MAQKTENGRRNKNLAHEAEKRKGSQEKTAMYVQVANFTPSPLQLCLILDCTFLLIADML
ncbi:hypothetical protein [Cytobacillus sp. BC1816]|uniref:hypothetical protein n=1 Tax=Cytobacillus sp. BC1816 TaxID=3440154 RepID=UPI003F50E17B